MYETKNDISKPLRVELNSLLNQRLADVIDLQIQLKQAHWNVKGPNFISLHELFDKVATGIAEYSDTIAERIVQLGGIAEGMSHVQAVVTAISKFGALVRHSITEATNLKDDGSADIFTEVSRGVDKWLWFVEAHGQTNT